MINTPVFCCSGVWQDDSCQQLVPSPGFSNG
jgi:hypothetical protein